MIKDDIKLSFRQMKRNKLVTAINFICLTIATSICCTVFMFYRYETSFDKERDPDNRIFRIYSSYSGTIASKTKNVPTGYGQFVKDNFSSIDQSTLFITWKANVSIPGKNPGEQRQLSFDDRVAFVDKSYFDVFSDYAWLKGRPEQATSHPGQVVLTESRAHYYFGDLSLDDIIGREIVYQDSLLVNVSGIVKDPKKNTDFDFTDFISQRTIESSWLKSNIPMNDWYGASGHLFLRKRNGASDADVRNDLTLLKKRSEKMTGNLGFFNDPQLEPVRSMHFNSAVGVFDHTRPILQKNTLEICLLLASVLLIMACANIVNIESARVSQHAKIVGIKKVLGTSNGLIIRQFLVSTAVIAILSIGVGLVSVYPIGYFFPSFFPQHIHFDIADPAIPVFSILLCLTITLIAGLYPALRSTGGTAVDALKNYSVSTRIKSESGFFRRVLIFFQYSSSQILVIVALVIIAQVNFMFEKDLGFKYDNILYFKVPGYSTISQRNVLTHKIGLDSRITSVSSESDLPMSLTVISATLEGSNGQERIKTTVSLKNVDSSYVKTFGLKILAGRELKSADSTSEYIINDTYRKMLGFKNPSDALGQRLNGKPIVGVVADFNTRSLHQEIGPLAISNDGRENSTISVRLSNIKNIDNLKSAISSIQAAWSSVFADEALNVKFMEQTVQAFYVDDIQASKLARVMAGLALAISSLGMFGLSMFTVSKRAKEAGIRRIFGATQPGVIFLLSKDVLRIVAISFVVSIPISFYLAMQWLEQFAYRVQLRPGLFIIAGFVSLAASAVTVGIIIFRGARIPVVEAIKE